MAIWEATGTSSPSITGTAYTLMGGGTPAGNMQVTPGDTGDMLAVFSATMWALIDSGTPPELVDYAIFVNGVEQAHTERHLFNELSFGSNHKWAVSTHCAFNYTTGTVEVRWKTNVSSGHTGHVSKRALTVMPVESYLQSTGTGTATATSSDYSATLMTLTPTGAGDYINLWGGTIRHGTGAASDNNMGVRVYVNGSHTGSLVGSERQYSQEGSFDYMNQPLSTVCLVQPGASQDVDIRWAHLSGADLMMCYERTQTLISVADSGDRIEVQSSSASTSSGSTPYLLMESTGVGTGPWLGMHGCSWRQTGGLPTGTDYYTYSFYVGEGTGELTYSQRTAAMSTSSKTSDYYTALVYGKVEPTGAEDVEIWVNPSTTTARVNYNRSLVLVREPTAPTGGGVDTEALRRSAAAFHHAWIVFPVPDGSIS